MGPATAVLVLPSLQWIETTKVETRRFDTLNTWYAPWTNGWTKSDVKGYCSDEQFNMQNFSCATNWADKLDGWVDSYIAARLSSYSMSVQGALTFAPNQTHVTNNAGKYESITWVASRQVLADLNNDGRLTRDGFAVAMHLIQGKLAGKEVPTRLPPTLVPPSMPWLTLRSNMHTRHCDARRVRSGKRVSIGRNESSKNLYIPVTTNRNRQSHQPLLFSLNHSSTGDPYNGTVR